jgi:hypothetical protein
VVDQAQPQASPSIVSRAEPDMELVNEW